MKLLGLVSLNPWKTRVYLNFCPSSSYLRVLFRISVCSRLRTDFRFRNEKAVAGPIFSVARGHTTTSRTFSYLQLYFRCNSISSGVDAALSEVLSSSCLANSVVTSNKARRLEHSPVPGWSEVRNFLFPYSYYFRVTPIAFFSTGT